MATPTNPNSGKTIARFGAKLINALLYEQPAATGDKRHSDPRSAVAGEVTVIPIPVTDENSRHRVFIRDLSRGGCGLWSRVRLEPGSTVMVILQTPEGEHVERPAVVCHCRGQEGSGYAVGVKFQNEPKSARSKPRAA